MYVYRLITYKKWLVADEYSQVTVTYEENLLYY